MKRRIDFFKVFYLVGMFSVFSGVVVACAPSYTIQPPKSVRPTATAAPSFCAPHSFETGIAFPEWNSQGYGTTDTAFRHDLPQMRASTGACWVQMPLLFEQNSLTATQVSTGLGTPTPGAFAEGIAYAHAQGLHVSIELLLNVNGSQSWSGSIHFFDLKNEQAWFAGYWQAVRPYVQVAEQQGAEQLAIGNEDEWLQTHAPSSLWDTLISQFHAAYQGKLTYDMNWTDLNAPVPAWMRNPDLTMIGVSAYLPRTYSHTPLTAAQIDQLWTETAIPELNDFAKRLGTSLFVSEMGYRATADVLYNPWMTTSNAPADPQAQATAYQVALKYLLTDPHIHGSFFWGWENTGGFDLAGKPSVQMIAQAYKNVH